MSELPTNTSKGRRFPAEPLTRDDVADLMAACSRRSASGIRNRALVALLFATGLRISEALALHVKDVDFAAATARVLHGKGDRDRTVRIAPEALDPLERWLDLRLELGIPRGAPIFCLIRGKPGAAMKADYVRQMFPRLARRAGIDKRVHAHGFRHGLAVHLANDPRVTTRAIQAQLGHARLSTTDAYVRRLAGPGELGDLFRGVSNGDGDPVDGLRRELDELRRELAELRGANNERK